VVPPDELLDDFATLPLQVKVAVLATEFRNLRSDLNDMKRTLRSIQVALWSLIIALLAVAGTLLAGHVH
jgi:hypothetical protein